MYPELFHFAHLTIYTYAFLIGLGTLAAVIYTKIQAKKDFDNISLPYSFFYLIFIMGFIGGKIFFYLENPKLYINDPGLLLKNFSGGFVFYGSFIFIIPAVIWYLKKKHISFWPMLDILAITTTIVHSIGRLGCFFGGCCYGKPTDSFTGMVFPGTHGTAVHPTQLYESLGVLAIMIILLQLKKRSHFPGQIFLTYTILYAVLRQIIELFRGDERGFIIEGYLSHSQFISLLIIALSGYLIFKLKHKNYSYETLH